MAQGAYIILSCINGNRLVSYTKWLLPYCNCRNLVEMVLHIEQVATDTNGGVILQGNLHHIALF